MGRVEKKRSLQPTTVQEVHLDELLAVHPEREDECRPCSHSRAVLHEDDENKLEQESEFISRLRSSRPASVSDRVQLGDDDAGIRSVPSGCPSLQMGSLARTGWSRLQNAFSRVRTTSATWESKPVNASKLHVRGRPI